MAKKETVQATVDLPTSNFGGYTEEQIHRIQLEGEMAALEAALTRSEDCGDWKISKFIENVLKCDKFWELFEKLELPYTRKQVEAFIKTRQEKRARINEIQAELAESEKKA